MKYCKITVKHPSTGVLMASYSQFVKRGEDRDWKNIRLHAKDLQTICRKKNGFLKPKIHVEIKGETK